MPIILPKSDKTEVYSFRTSKKILENLKKYAKATDTKMPKALNKILENTFKGKTLTREKNQNIRIPSYVKMTTGEIKQLPNSFENETITIFKKKYQKYVFFKNQYYKYFQDVYFNNCLDIWRNNTYQSSIEGRKHDGLAITCDENEKYHYIKIEQYNDDSYFAYIIQKPQAVKQVKKANNRKLLEIIGIDKLYSTPKEPIIVKFSLSGGDELLDKNQEQANEIEQLKLRIEELESKIEKQ